MIIIILLAVLLFSSGKNNRDYKASIQMKNDSITVLNDLNYSLQSEMKFSLDTFKIIEQTILLYQDSLGNVRILNYRNNKAYEAKISDITSIPSDTMYRELSDWLNSR